MITDNKWHDGILFQKQDGGFVLREAPWDFEQDLCPSEITDDKDSYEVVRYNWNRGQPLIESGNCKASVVDLNFEKKL